LGCWALGDPGLWGPQDQQDTQATIHTALDQGITFLDTAPAYGHGHSEEVVGAALVGRRASAFIATKVNAQNSRRDDLVASCEASLQRLQTDYIDLLQIHWPSREIPFTETIGALEGLQSAGKIRAYGVCNFGPQDLAAWLEAGGRATTNQVSYSLLSRAVEFAIAPQAAAAGMHLLAYSPLMQGLLTGKFPTADSVPEGRARSLHFSGDRPKARHGQAGFEDLTFATLTALRQKAEAWGIDMAAMALAWLLAQNPVGAILVGARTPAQVERNRQATQVKLEASQYAELSRLTDELKQAMGPEADLWSSPSRIR